MPITLQRLTTAHVEELQQLSIKTYRETFDEHNSEENMTAYLRHAYHSEKLMRELQHPDSQFYFVYDDDQLAGYLKVNMNEAQTEDMGSDALEIERIYLLQAFHRKGLGKYLFDKAVSIALSNNKQCIWLGVWEHNVQALAFYKQMGFVPEGRHSFFMGDDEQTDLILVKNL